MKKKNKPNSRTPTARGSAQSRQPPRSRRTDQLSNDDRIRDRTSRRKRKNRRKKIIVRTVLCAVLLIAGTIFALTMFFNIDAITVTGDAVYSAEDVKAASGVNMGDNLIFISKKKINDAVCQALPYVGEVKVKRRLPTGLELSVTKTEAVYAIAENGYYTLLDRNAKVLEGELESVAENITLINIGEIISAQAGKAIEVKNAKFLEKLNQLRTALEECGLTGITSIDLSDIYNIKLNYQGRIIIELGDTDESTLVKKLALGKSAIDDRNKTNPDFRGEINLTVAGQAYLAEKTVTTEPQTAPSTQPAEGDGSTAENTGSTAPADKPTKEAEQTSSKPSEAA